MTLVQILNGISAATALSSAVFWVRSALVEPIIPLAWLGGPPKEISDRIRRQAKLNSWAAILSGITASLQASVFAISSHLIAR